jgi:excinuclease ABC subunit C
LQSILDNIPGIGQNRKKALLTFFGDTQKIKSASIETLQGVDGIGLQMARNIFTFLKEKDGEADS